MRFIRRPRKESRSIAVFCGAFHPPTVAHLALATSAREHVDEVMWVMPERFPHKEYERVGLEGRLALIEGATSDAIAVARGSLFFEIAAEAEAALGASVRLLIGEDGARRVVDWDYGLDREAHLNYLAANLQRYPVLTARREATWDVPTELADYFAWMALADAHADVSSTVVRMAIDNGAPWRHLVPEPIHTLVEELYGSAGKASGQ
jgi:nicotinic acid mononucleotide adenylyltransferase